jgi:hypothetical protein
VATEENSERNRVTVRVEDEVVDVDVGAGVGGVVDEDAVDMAGKVARLHKKTQSRSTTSALSPRLRCLQT